MIQQSHIYKGACFSSSCMQTQEEENALVSIFHTCAIFLSISIKLQGSHRSVYMNHLSRKIIIIKVARYMALSLRIFAIILHSLKLLIFGDTSGEITKTTQQYQDNSPTHLACGPSKVGSCNTLQHKSWVAAIKINATLLYNTKHFLIHTPWKCMENLTIHILWSLKS